MIQKMISLLLFLFLCCVVTKGIHFNGGTITWEPIYPYSNLSIVPITITQTYSWTYPLITCATNVPISTSGRSSANANLTCIADCTTDGGYQLKPVSILTDCQTASSSMGLMTSQRSVNINLTADAHFYLAYLGSAWVPLNDPAKSGLQWSIVCSIDLRMRPDGIINTPPVASVVTPQYAIVNKTTQITIPVSDANAGDDVRCRWSVYTAGSRRRKRSDEENYIDQNYATQIDKKPSEEKENIHIRKKRGHCKSCSSTCYRNSPCCCSACSGTTCSGPKCTVSGGCVVATTTVDTPGTLAPTSSYPNHQAIDECGGICYPGSVPNGTTLSGCTISFIGLLSDTWYAVALQVEDFINSTSNISMSSVPVQFLIYVMDQPTCGLAPILFPVSRCFDAQVGVTTTFNISTMTLCNPNISDIDSIIMSTSSVGMDVSDTTDSLTNASVSYATFTWIPTTSQLGSQKLCVMAYTDEQIQSQQYCVTFNVITSPAACITTTTTSTTTTSRTTSTLSTSSTTTSTTTSTESTTTATTTSTASTTSTSETTTTTSTSTSTATSTTTSTTSTSTTTTTTSTTTTTVTTTSVTTTKEAMTPRPETNWLLISGLSLLSLLLAVCCSCCCLYWLWWGPAAKYRRRKKAQSRAQRDSIIPINKVDFTRKSDFPIQVFKSDTNYYNYNVLNAEDDPCNSANIDLSTFSANQDRRFSIKRVSNTEKPTETGNASIEPPNHKDDDEIIPSIQYSTVTVQRVSRSSILNTRNNNQSTLIPKTSRVSVTKIPRKKSGMNQLGRSSSISHLNVPNLEKSSIEMKRITNQIHGAFSAGYSKKNDATSRVTVMKLSRNSAQN